MKKISLRGLSEVLSEKALKNVMGGSGYPPEGYTHYCTCSEHVGSWWGYYPTNDYQSDIALSCRGGGTCDRRPGM